MIRITYTHKYSVIKYQYTIKPINVTGVIHSYLIVEERNDHYEQQIVDFNQ